jgi:NAD(P)-dependent dehydrogenase (short-subunit alcohol dehydrogenase family)
MASSVVITGCSSGFGLATAVAFADRGDRVVATMRNPARRGALDAALAAAGGDAAGNVEVVAMDVDDDASVRAAMTDVIDHAGPIDVLVNNAGIGGRGGPIEALSDEDWLAVLGTNVLGTVRTTRAVLPGMRERGAGTIVNVSSMAGRLPGSAMLGPYSASKHAVCAFSDSLWGEVEDLGVAVHCIEPGWFATSIVDNSTLPDWEGSPYQAHAQLAEQNVRDSVAAAPGPKAVVDAILDATNGVVGDSIHRPVGDDAVLAVAARGQMTYFEFHAMARELSGRPPA